MPAAGIKNATEAWQQTPDARGVVWHITVLTTEHEGAASDQAASACAGPKNS